MKINLEKPVRNKTMIEVIRIFYVDERIMKPYYNSAKMNYLNKWPGEGLYSCASKIENRLVVLKKMASNVKLDNSIGVLVIFENKSEDQSDISVYPKNARILNLGPLKMKRMKDSFFEIHAISSEDISLIEIPSPQRAAHKVSEIKPHKTIRYRTNYKYDTWGMMRGQRSFLEQDYIIEHLGFVDEIDFSMNEKTEVKLTVDNLVNERKILK
jgi:hypothetical protein